MNIISRKQWGAVRAKEGISRVPAGQRTEFIVHYSGASADQSVAAIQAWCIDGRGFKDIDYNFLVRGTTGEIYYGRGWSAVGSHTVGHNTRAWGVCVISDGPISDLAKMSVRELYTEAVKRAGHGLTVLGHRDAASTDCPGDTIYAWVHAHTSWSTPAAGHRTVKLTDPYMRGADVRKIQFMVGAVGDGLYGPKTADRVKVWQRTRGLTPDGIVGPKTWAKMLG